jgi:hypothetical protein
MKAGDIVKINHPVSDVERDERWEVLDVRGDELVVRGLVSDAVRKIEDKRDAVLVSGFDLIKQVEDLLDAALRCADMDANEDHPDPVDDAIEYMREARELLRDNVIGVLVQVRGGVAEATHVPLGVEVDILDHDNAQVAS